VCPGGTASVRIRVTNCTMTNRVVHLQAAGAHAADVKFNPATLTLGPMERDFAVASFATPPKAGHGEEWEVLLWVRGCRDHYLRWTIKANDRGQDSCHEVEVDDCPDLVHHWYDHFYCDRACTHQR
ncbi:MAG: hypothetical protein LUO93_00445, partial [Methanomicrobiales archaeon]|nr:hypothetical protein [Methanomicrobiales archaeon]